MIKRNLLVYSEFEIVVLAYNRDKITCERKRNDYIDVVLYVT